MIICMEIYITFFAFYHKLFPPFHTIKLKLIHPYFLLTPTNCLLKTSLLPKLVHYLNEACNVYSEAYNGYSYTANNVGIGGQ